MSPKRQSDALAVPDGFSRLDETDDAEFYSRARLVYHMDDRARQTVRRVIETLIVEEEPAILDLMASWDSHVPDSIRPREMVGLGLNEEELKRNELLDRYVLHDLNRNPKLPFRDESFDVVINTVSVDYMTRPFDVFAEVSRILVPGGLFLVLFSNRLFPQKAVKVWREADELSRQMLVVDFFESVASFGKTYMFTSRGKPRPTDDKYAGLGIPSDPVWAICAERKGAPDGRKPRPRVQPEPDACPPPEVVEERKARVKETLECPYCEQKLEKFEIPPSPFCEWGNEFVYVCFNNDCPYLISGWDVMTEQGNHGYSYRLMYNPDLNKCMATPVPSTQTARTAVVTPRG